MEQNFYKKYLKYKNKYFGFKNRFEQKGGSKNEIKLMLFKANWCGHCKAFEPTWENLKKDKELKQKYVKLITYDSEKNKKELKSWNISGFPTLILQKNNKAYEYNGVRAAVEIKKFIDEMV